MEHSYTSKHEARCDLTLVVRCQKCEQSKNEILKSLSQATFSFLILSFKNFFSLFFEAIFVSINLSSSCQSTDRCRYFDFPRMGPLLSLSLSLSLSHSLPHTHLLLLAPHTHTPFARAGPCTRARTHTVSVSLVLSQVFQYFLWHLNLYSCWVFVSST